jgi:hypothetical protein
VVAAGVRASRLIRKREDGLVGCCYLATGRRERRSFVPLHLFLGASSDRLSFPLHLVGCGDNERLVQLRVRAGAFYKPLTIMIRDS